MAGDAENAEAGKIASTDDATTTANRRIFSSSIKGRPNPDWFASLDANGLAGFMFR